MLRFGACLVVLALALVPIPGYAQEAPLEQVDVEQLVRALEPKQTILVRGLSVEPSDSQIPSVDLAIHFDYNSDTLTGEAKSLLAVLAAALQSDQLRNHHFRLVGHTDAKGPVEYNQRLSLQRALAVRAYLVDEYGLETTRLDVDGMGESQLLFPDQPDDARNRRVAVATED